MKLQSYVLVQLVGGELNYQLKTFCKFQCLKLEGKKNTLQNGCHLALTAQSRALSTTIRLYPGDKHNHSQAQLEEALVGPWSSHRRDSRAARAPGAPAPIGRPFHFPTRSTDLPQASLCLHLPQEAT